MNGVEHLLDFLLWRLLLEQTQNFTPLFGEGGLLIGELEVWDIFLLACWNEMAEFFW